MGTTPRMRPLIPRPSLRALRRANPQTDLIKTIENMGIRVGLDKIPGCLKHTVPLSERIKAASPAKGSAFAHGREPRWHRATLPLPEMEIRPRMLSKTPLGKFMAAEVKRRKSWNKAEYWRNLGLPEGSITNPFIPFMNPITRRWNSPLYSLPQQSELVSEARRLGITDLLPSGPKTPETHANESMQAYVHQYAHDMKTVIGKVEQGEVKWHGVYVKRLNPFGAGRFVEGGTHEDMDHTFAGIPRWGNYKGRLDMFKGTLRQRKRPARIAAIDERMQTMQRRIEIWKKEKQAEKIKAYSSLPF